jgi:hypothetical protein
MTRSHSSSTRIPALDGWRGVAIFLFAFAVIVARRPDAVFNAQFFAEDGRNWFADAYNYGWWRVLFKPYEGYLHIVPRLAAALALLVPTVRAALVENLTAIAIQAIPVNLMLSSRSAPWGSLRFRALLAALYLFLPNTREMVGTVAESQWFLALIALLVLVALPPQSRMVRAFDLSALVLCSLTGPFCIFLFPIAAFLMWRTARWQPSAVLFIGCITQALSLFLHFPSRLHPTLGANLEGFVRILAGQVYLGTLLGGNGLSLLLSAHTLAWIAVIGILVMVLCASSAPAPMRALLLLSCLLFIAGLARPTAIPPPGMTAWHLMMGVSGIRYWFFPTLVFAWSIAYCAQSTVFFVRTIAVCLFVLMPVGLVRDFRYPALGDLTSQYVRLAEAPAGTAIVLPINPSGWNMRLIKR